MGLERSSWERARAVGAALLMGVFMGVCVACGGPSWQPAPGVSFAPPADPSAIDAEGFFDEEGSPKRSAPAAKETRIGAATLRGTPTVPASLSEKMSQYVDARYASVGDVASDGSGLLVTTRFGQTAQLHLVASPLAARHQVTFAAEPVREPRFVPGSEGALTFMRDVGGNEQYQIWRRRPNGEVVLLTDGKSRHGGYSWSPDGQRLAFTSNARNGKDMDVYVSDGVSPASVEKLLEREGTWWVGDWSHDGRLLLLGEYVSINDSRLFVLEVASGVVRPVTPPSPRASYRQARFSADDQRLFVTTDREGEFVELFEVAWAKGTEPTAYKPLSRHLAHNVEEIALSPDGRTLAMTVNEGGFGTLHLCDVKSGKVTPAPNVPSGIVSDLRFARGAPVLGLSLQGATRTGDAYTYDLRQKKLTRWTQSELGGLDPSRWVEPELVAYDTFDGRKIPAFVYRPKTPGPHPVLVSIHGGPEAQARPFFSPLTQYLVAESGIAVVVPNVRGSDGYGKSYLLLDNGLLREDSVKDIGALLDFIAADPALDGQRVGVMGGSYGGYMVLASLIHYGERIKAGIDYVGISNFVTFLKNTQAYRRDLRRAEYGDERVPEMLAHLTKISPTENADRIRSALFVAHGRNDPRVPVSETDQIVEAVTSAGRPVWYMVADNEGHGFRKQDNRRLFYELSVLFLEQHLAATRPSGME